jgi:hypothetical protein
VTETDSFCETKLGGCFFAYSSKNGRPKYENKLTLMKKEGYALKMEK